MVSPLSARLMSGRAASCSAAADGKVPSLPSLHPGSDSGYSADGSCSEGPPLGRIDLLVKHKRDYPTSTGGEHAKRRKINERQFKASNAKEDLTRAGLPIPKLHTDKPRAIAVATNLNMSGVKHVFSKTVEASPFLAPVNEYGVTSFEFDADSGKAYHDVVQICRFAYSAPNRRTNRDSDSESLTSSLSETEESDGSQNNLASLLVIQARVEDALETKNDPVKPSETSRQHSVACPSSLTVSLEEALAVSQSARLMVLSNHPYTVIHSNAAFSRLTGVPSSNVLGRKLSDLFHGGAPEKFSLPACVASPGDTAADIITQEFDQKDDNKATQPGFVGCNLNVRPVRTGLPKDLNDVSHFVVDLTAVAQKPGVQPNEGVHIRASHQQRTHPATQVLG